ncbi:MAG TPA: hypothetical protein VJT50_08015 [Pyrinomonadaceae bacterium]|nr:hypothetical protein [Pyrinomonadaceae bacterium]
MCSARILVRLSLVMLLLVIARGGAVMGQTAASDTSPARAEAQTDETNVDTQLYLLVGTNHEVDDAKVPAALDSVMKQLRASLPFKNYRLAATLINRVKNDARLNLKWIGGPMMASAAASGGTPSFNEFRVNNVKLKRDATGALVIKMDGFSFGTRIPVQTGTALASNGPQTAPIINYENTGLNTDISMREGEPVMVGTLNVGPSGDAIILVVSAKRTNK